MAAQFFRILKTELQYAQEFETAEDYDKALGENLSIRTVISKSLIK